MILTAPRALAAALALTVAMAGRVSAQTPALAWEERALAAGGRVIAVGGLSPGFAGVFLALPAGTAMSTASPQLALLAPRAFLGSRASWESAASPLEAGLARLGWRLETHCELESAEIALLGPASGLETVLGFLRERLAAPGALDAAGLESAWQALAADRARSAASPELALREAMAAPGGANPGAGGGGEPRLEPAAQPPALEALGAFVAEHYQAGAALLLIAGDFEPLALLERWQPALDALPGRPLPPPRRQSAARGAGGELRRPGSGSTLLLYQFPALAGSAPSAPATALLAGLLNQFVQRELRGEGLASAGSAWYDFSAPGPRPLELQLRGFAPERLAPLRTKVERILDRLRRGEFSEYQVITAKDQLFTRIDAASGRGRGPADDSLQALTLWGREVLREGLYFAAWRERFVADALALSSADLRAEAERLLQLDRATMGLLLPPESLD